VVPQAQRLGTTLFQTHPVHAVTEQYRDIAREIEERLTAFTTQRVPREPSETHVIA
jgi:nitrogenase subunit NifH